MKRKQKKQQQKAPSSKENTKDVTTKEAPSAEETNKVATEEEAPAVEETNAKSNSNAQPAETERTHVVDTVAKDLYKNLKLQKQKLKLKKYYQKIFQIYLMKKLKNSFK